MSRNRTKRDETLDWTLPVTAIGIERAAGGKSIRDVSHSTWTRTSISPVFHGKANIYAEGANERLALWHERYVRRSTDFLSQPEIISLEIAGFIVRHIPDYLSHQHCGPCRLEVKGITALAYQPWLPLKFGAIGRAYAQLGYRFEFVTGADLRRQPLAVAVDEVWRAKRVRVPLDDRDRIVEALNRGPATYGALRSLLGPGDPRRILALHADDTLTIDLKFGPIGDSSPVYPGPVDLGSYAGQAP